MSKEQCVNKKLHPYYKTGIYGWIGEEVDDNNYIICPICGEVLGMNYCDYAGEQGYDNKCPKCKQELDYSEIYDFEDTCYFEQLLKIKDSQIADLETKLAESEKQIKDAREAGNMAVDSWCKNRRKYEAQIAEMQNKSFILYSMLYETLEKQGCDNVASQIDQMTGWTYDKEADWLKGNRNYDQLKQQLAESERKLEEYKKCNCKECMTDYEKNLNQIIDKYLNENINLKQQLHDLPKKIVEEVEKSFTEYLPLKYKTGAGFYSRLNAILKKFGGEENE